MIAVLELRKPKLNSPYSTPNMPLQGDKSLTDPDLSILGTLMEGIVPWNLRIVAPVRRPPGRRGGIDDIEPGAAGTHGALRQPGLRAHERLRAGRGHRWHAAHPAGAGYQPRGHAAPAATPAGRGRFLGCLRNYRKSGEEYLCEIDVRPILGRDGVLQAFIAFEREVVRRRGRPTEGGTRRYRPTVQTLSPLVALACRSSYDVEANHSYV